MTANPDEQPNSSEDRPDDQPGQNGSPAETDLLPAPENIPDPYDELRRLGDPGTASQGPTSFSLLDDRGPTNPYPRQQPVFRENSERLATGSIDVANYLRAQNQYIRAQTIFLRLQSTRDGDVYVRALTAFSVAQGTFIDAQAEILHQLGIL